MSLTAAQLKMIKMLQSDPELLARVQDPNAFSQAIAETRIDRNHRFILSALNATERTNYTNDEREAQDVFINDLALTLDEIVSQMEDRFKVKSNEKGEAWHALSFQTESGQTLNIKVQTSFAHKPNTDWSAEENEVSEVAQQA